MRHTLQTVTKPPTRLPLYVGIVLIALGWGAIFLAWQRAAALDLETGQLPYVLSGGFGGFGLLLLGSAGVVVDVILRTQWRSRETIDALRSAIEGLAEAVAKPADEVGVRRGGRRRGAQV
jgi:hypothetical protein